MKNLIVAILFALSLAVVGCGKEGVQVDACPCSHECDCDHCNHEEQNDCHHCVCKECKHKSAEECKKAGCKCCKHDVCPGPMPK